MSGAGFVGRAEIVGARLAISRQALHQEDRGRHLPTLRATMQRDLVQPHLDLVQAVDVAGLDLIGIAAPHHVGRGPDRLADLGMRRGLGPQLDHAASARLRRLVLTRAAAFFRRGGDTRRFEEPSFRPLALDRPLPGGAGA